MKRLLLGFAGGITAVVLSAALLWLLLPFLLSAISNSEAWLGWLPFAVAFPALLLGGFAAARLSPSYRSGLGFIVGLAASGLVASFTVVAGQFMFLLFAVFFGGVLGAVGARLSGNRHVSP